jgi:hypothetical protein
LATKSGVFIKKKKTEVRTVPLTPQSVPPISSIDSPRTDPINSEATKKGEISVEEKIIQETKQTLLFVCTR